MSAIVSSGSNIDSTAGRIFLKNLDQSVNILCLFDAFSVFGKIVSCKVSADEGISRGYAFVQFETEEAAQKAVLEGNGILIAGKEVLVEKFKTRAERGESSSSFTNLFVKNFGEELDDVKLKTIFEVFGEITSCVVIRDANSKSKGFGFVAFNNAEDAAKAVTEMHEKTLVGSGRQLFVCRAQKRSERQEELRKQFEQQEVEDLQDAREVTLFVKNINGSIDDEGLTKMFADFGNVTSVKIMRCKNGRSRGKGFVCFEKADDATSALNSMNCKIVGFKTLHVTFAQHREELIAQRVYQSMERLAEEKMANQFPVTPMYVPVLNGNVVGYSPMHQNQNVFFPGVGFAAPLMSMPPHGASGMEGHQEFNPFMPHNVGSMPQSPQQFYPAPLHADSGFGYPAVPMQPQAVFQPPQVGIYPAPTYAMQGPHVMNHEKFTQLSRARLEIDGKLQESSTAHMNVDEAVPAIHQSEKNRHQA